MIHIRLGIDVEDVPRKDKLFVNLPFSVYLGWISVAIIANIAASLNYLGWDGFGFSEATWTVIMLVVAVIITVLVLLKKRDIVFSLVIIWAVAGIVVKQAAVQEIVIAGSAGAIIIIITLAFVLIKKMGYNAKTAS